MNYISLIFIIIILPLQVFAHARLKSDGILIPRSNSAGLKTGPCGGVTRTNSSVELTAGETITITWEETVQHPGRYEFSISLANDQNFVRMLVVPDTQDNRNDLPHQYSASFTVPSIACEACTFQMIQVMTENPNNPSLYYSCADIKIIAGEEEPSGQMPAPVPSPSDIPNPVDPIINNGPIQNGDGESKGDEHEGCSDS